MAPATPPAATRMRLPGLDLLRLLAALMVVLFHYTYHGASFTPTQSPLNWPAVQPVTMYGYLGVSLFFIISGFVISWSIERYNTWSFLRARLLRLLPAFIICLSLTSLFVVLWGAPQFTVTLPQILVNLTFFAGLLKVEYVDGVYWTLQTEWLFYLSIAAALATGLFPRYLLSGVTVWLAACGVMKFIGHGAHPVTELLGKMLIVDYAPFFIIGILLSTLRRNPNQWLPYALLFAAVMMSCHSLGYYTSLQYVYAVRVNPVVMSIMPAILVSLVTAIIWWPAWKYEAQFKTLGSLTYPLYLLHSKIGYIIFWANVGLLPAPLLIIIVTTLALAAAYIVAVYLEPTVSNVLNHLLPRTLQLRLFTPRRA